MLGLTAFRHCSLGVYVDDVTMEIEGRDTTAVAAVLGDAAEAISKFVHDDLRGSAAARKAATVTNYRDVLHARRRGFGISLSGAGDGRSAPTWRRGCRDGALEVVDE